MTYKEQMEEAKKAKTTVKLNPAFVTWDKAGQAILGRYLDRIEVQSTVGPGSYYQYLFDTDDGKVKFAMGSATDKEVGFSLVKNNIYQVTFLGKEPLSGGRTINRFEVVEVWRQVVADTGEETVPF